ncbi:MAG: hypothetical protein ACRDPK_03540 [Carbonactinosporaceae bacterium]
MSEDPVRLRSRRIAGGLQFKLRHQFRLVEAGRKDWHVSTVAHAYRLNDNAGDELVTWHWHPGLRGVDYPHLHVTGGPVGRRAHLPSGRVSIESVLRLLLDDLGVPAKRDDYWQVLDASEGPFLRYRRWG